MDSRLVRAGAVTPEVAAHWRWPLPRSTRFPADFMSTNGRNFVFEVFQVQALPNAGPYMGEGFSPSVIGIRLE